MKWDDAVRAAVAALEGDSELTTALGGSHIYRAGAKRAPQIPSVEWLVVMAGTTELTEPVTVQFDVWARGYSQALTIEARVRAVLHSDTPTTYGGLTLWSRYTDSRDHQDPEPGVAHRSLDFVLEPARSDR